jgi:hypothetical protein
VKDFDYERVTRIIGERFTKESFDVDIHGDIVLYEVIEEYTRLGVKPTRGQIIEAVNVLFESDAVHYKIKIGDYEYNLKNNVDDLIRYIPTA